IDFLAVQRGGTVCDATVGLGGHSLAIARRLGAPGHLIGVDKDPAALEISSARLQAQSDDWPEVELRHASLPKIGKQCESASLDGLRADLGVSSLQFDPRRADSVFRR